MLTEFQRIVSKKSGKVIQNFPLTLKKGNVAFVECRALQSVYVATFASFPHFGRILLRDGHTILAAGVVTEILEKTDAFYQITNFKKTSKRQNPKKKSKPKKETQNSGTGRLTKGAR